MEFRPLDITVLSARDLKNVKLMTRMDVYAVVSISGDPATAQRTPVHKNAGTSPEWNFPMKFTIDVAAAGSNRLTIVFKLMSRHLLGDKKIGEVLVLVKDILHADAVEGVMRYPVRTPKGKAKGSLDFKYQFGEKYSYATPQPQPPPFERARDEPVWAYPAMAQPGPSTTTVYPPPPYPSYGYPKPYPAQGYGYPPVQQPVSWRMGSGNFGLGLAGGLLGGLLIGDMIGDATDMGT